MYEIRATRRPRLVRRGPWSAGTALLASLAVFMLVARASAAVVRLEELEARALEQRGALGAASQRTTTARIDAHAVRTAFSPTVTLNVDGSGAPGQKYVRVTDVNGDEFLVAGSRSVGQSGAFAPHGRYGAVVSLQARLYDFGRTSSAIAAADARVAATQAAEGATRASIVQEVRATYLSWVEAVALHATAERALTTARARREIVEGRVATGVRPASDLDSVRYDEALARLDEAGATGSIEDARLEMQRVAATPLGGDALPDAALLDRDTPPSSIPPDAPATMVLYKQRAAALAEARYHDNEMQPILAAGADAGVRGQDADVFPIYRAAVSLSVPFWDGGVAGARARASRSEAAALEADEREERAHFDAERRRAWNDYATARERLKIAGNLLELAAARARDAEDRYSLGNERIEIVLEASVAVSRAEREVLLAKVARADSILRLSALSGHPPTPNGRGAPAPAAP